ncbi:MAG: sprT domain-containing protein [Bacteroidetes bacterium]|nr:MAG: sprT domain-containing protein [Bacteroidota bacterium]
MQGHRISINENLNEYSFLLTLIHEVSHLIVWEAFKRKFKPHGTEWKRVFQEQMNIINALNLFPEDLAEAIRASMKNPKASAHADKSLAIALRKYDSPSKSVFLDELDYDTVFMISKGRTFLKGEKQRTRYKCKELTSGKSYLFSPLAEVMPV